MLCKLIAMKLKLEYYEYIGGTTEETVKYPGDWRDECSDLFCPYPVLLPKGCPEGDKFYHYLGEFAWATWKSGKNRKLAVYYYENEPRRFLNFLYLVYVDNDNSITRALCSLSPAGWKGIKEQLKQQLVEIEISKTQVDDESQRHISEWDYDYGLAMRFPLRYHNEVYTGAFKQFEDIFPRKPQEALPSDSPEEPPIETKKKKGVVRSQFLLLIGVLIFVGALVHVWVMMNKIQEELRWMKRELESLRQTNEASVERIAELQKQLLELIVKE